MFCLKRNKAARVALKGDPNKYPGGDFRSAECVAYLKQADIVVTNPPFYAQDVARRKRQFWPRPSSLNS